MKTGIVILNYNTPELTIALTKRCNDMRAFDYVIVVDNNSNHSCISYLKCAQSEFGQQVIFIYNDTNCGYARGNNIGLKKLIELECDICFVTNPDSEFTENVIERMLYFFNNNKDYGVLTTCRIPEKVGNKIRQYWSFPTKTELLLENFYLYNKLHKSKNEIYSVVPTCNIKEIGVAPGAFFGIRASLLKDINYLDENTFLYFEENCLAAKIKNTSYKIGLVSDVFYVCLDRKKNSTAVIQLSTFSRKCYIKSKEYFARKYLNCGNLYMCLLKFFDFIFLFEKFIYVKIKKSNK